MGAWIIPEGWDWKQPSLGALSCLFSPLLVSNYPRQAGFVKSWLYPVVVGCWAQLDVELLMLKFVLIPHIPRFSLSGYSAAGASPHPCFPAILSLQSWGPAEIKTQGIIHRFTRKPQPFPRHPYLDLWSEKNQVRIHFPHLCPSIPCTSLIQHKLSLLPTIPNFQSQRS